FQYRNINSVSTFRRQLRQKSDPSLTHRIIAARGLRLLRSSGGLRFPARPFLGLTPAQIFAQSSRQALAAIAAFLCFAVFVHPAHGFNYPPSGAPRKPALILRHRGPLWQFPPRSRPFAVCCAFSAAVAQW